MKLYAFGTWNEEEMYYDFAGHVVANSIEEAELKAKDEFVDDDIEAWEVKVKGYKIEVKED